MIPTDFVCHSYSSRPIVNIIPPIASSYSSSLPCLTIHVNFNIIQQFWFIQPNHLEYVFVDRTCDASIESTQIIIHHSDTRLYSKLARAISKVCMRLKDEFEDQHNTIIESTIRKLQSIMTREMSNVFVDVTLLIDYESDGRILLALEESSMDGMVSASESSKAELLSKLRAIREENQSLKACASSKVEVPSELRPIREENQSLKGGASSKVELLSELRSAKEDNRSLMDRLSAVENEMKELKKLVLGSTP